MEMKAEPYKITGDVWMVPCTLDSITKRYLPVIKPLEAGEPEKKFDNRKSWSHEEDEFLKGIIEIHGPKNWSAIAVELNEKAHRGKQVRKGKQCRERWLGYLCPNVNKVSWNQQEDAILLVKQATIGNKWKEISKLLPGRTENQIKNRWRNLRNQFLVKENEDNLIFASLPIEFMVQQIELKPMYLTGHPISLQENYSVRVEEKNCD